MPKVSGILLDLGGVVYVGNEVLPGAQDALARLRGAGLPIRYITNTTRQPLSGLLAKLHGLGLDATESEVFAPARAARAYLEDQGLRPHLLVHPALVGEFDGLDGTAGTAVVVGDAAEGFTYEALNGCFRVLAAGGDLLALAKNRTFRDADNELSLDAGPFVAALEYASGKTARVFGKPAPDFFHAAVASLGCSPADTVMIGDDAESDVGGALDAGLMGILVRTGKYTPGAEAVLGTPPTHIADDLAAAVDWILR